MKKSDLVLSLSALYPFLEITQINQIINIVFDELTNALKTGNRIEIRGFGAFSLRSRKVQLEFPSDSNPLSTNKTLQLKDRNTVYFRIGKDYFDSLNAD